MAADQPSGDGAGVVIVGGGVAALEFVMAFRALAGEHVGVTVIAPDEDFVYRPMSVVEPFGGGPVRRYALRNIAADFGGRFVRAKVTSVDADERHVVLRSGDTLPYDTLVLAPGARTPLAFDDAITFGQPGSSDAMRALVAEVEHGAARRVAFVVPTAVGWNLPLYELALMLGEHARRRNVEGTAFHLITPESRPLDVFGDRPSAAVAGLLQAAGVEFIGSAYAAVRPGQLELQGRGGSMPVDRVVALPLIRGPKLDGVPLEPRYGFIPVDRYGHVRGLEDVYAAGDAIDFPIKQGGLAAQQADSVAHQVAGRHGAAVEPAPFRPVLRGMLLTGDMPRFLHSDVGRGRDRSTMSSHALWWPPTKIAGRYLAPYLYGRDPTAAGEQPPQGFEEVDVPVSETRLPPPQAHDAGAALEPGSRD